MWIHLLIIWLCWPVPGLDVRLPGGHQAWLTDFEQAKQVARQENKEILMVFSGSDWCKPCIRLEQQIFTSDIFQAYALEHLVLLKVDFPRRKENRLSDDQLAHNERLAEQYNEAGAFPHLLLISWDGHVLRIIDAPPMDPGQFVQSIEDTLNKS